MTAAVGLALGGMVLTILLNLAGWLVAWGALKTTVKALAERVATLEGEVSVIGELRVQMARLEARVESLLEQLRVLNANLHWMRMDTPPGAPPAAARTSGRRRADLS